MFHQIASSIFSEWMTEFRRGRDEIQAKVEMILQNCIMKFNFQLILKFIWIWILILWACDRFYVRYRWWLFIWKCVYIQDMKHTSNLKHFHYHTYVNGLLLKALHRESVQNSSWISLGNKWYKEKWNYQY